MSDEHIVKSHNRTLLLYHLVFPAKCRLKVFTPEVEETLRRVCLRIEECYEIRFVEIGMEADHVHFLVQGVPAMPVSRIVTIIKSVTAREIFKAHPSLKKDLLWGGSLWASGFYSNTVGLYASKDTIRKCIHNQGKDGGEYRKVYEDQPELDFWRMSQNLNQMMSQRLRYLDPWVEERHFDFNDLFYWQSAEVSASCLKS